MSSSNKDSVDHSRNVSIGRSYEKLAALFFEQNGFEVLRRNWRAGRKEIDLIVQKENLLVFVEVKSSASKKYGHPSERIDERKKINLTEAARQFVIAEDIKDLDLRFDVVTFVNGQLEHYPGAFDATES